MIEKKNGFWRKIKRIFLGCMLLFFGSSVFLTILYRFIPPPITPLMLIRCYQQIKDDKDLRLTKDWVSIEEISPQMIKAVITAEDQLFMTHFGIDFQAIEKAATYNEKKKGKKIRGASTITQQTAKNVFLWPNRSYLRKALEVYYTFLIETLWSKERIMEVYLNVIEMGNGIYGIEAAAQNYYGISAKKLNRSQAAMITTILPAPQKRNPRNPSAYMYRHQAWILKMMNDVKTIHLAPANGR